MSPQERAAYEAWKQADADADELRRSRGLGMVRDLARAMSAAKRVLWLAVGGLAVILAVVMAEAMP
jgi:hypothetical protein